MKPLDSIVRSEESPPSTPQYVRVAIPRPIRRTFDYRIPPSLRGQIVPGQRIRCSFAGASEIGFVVELLDRCELEESRVKEIAGVVDPHPLLGAGGLELTHWMASYYGCSWGEALAAALPSAVRQVDRIRSLRLVRLTGEAGRAAWFENRGRRRPAQRRVLEYLCEQGDGWTVSELARRVGVNPGAVRALLEQGLVRIEETGHPQDDLNTPADERPEPTPDQKFALGEILERVEARTYAAFLLWGVTGSGKTEVYLRAIERVVEQGRQAIVLVPEIALTPQTVSRFRARFERVALLHSQQTDAERRRHWEKIHEGEVDVVVGPRSAVFAPVPRLGLVVVDEEHETTFKQNNTPRYHARDVALVRAKRAGAVVVLGSATPSLETFHGSEIGKNRLLRLPERVAHRQLPRVTLVDMSLEAGSGRRKSPGLFSRMLERAIRKALERGEQVILFLNRRGFSTFLVCRRCGYVLVCPNCNVTFTHHKRTRRIVCHHCLHEAPPPRVCPECLTGKVHYRGLGTERIEEVATTLFPGVRLARMDSDTMTDRRSYERVLSSFGAGEIDLLIGTQMIAKGLDFPRVTVVGVISADTLLSFPDFRSAERTFQLITQVAGRAGRGDRAGQVIVQSFHPGHYAIQYAAGHDYEAFAREELGYRESLGYPPYGRLIRILVASPDPDRAVALARELAGRVRGILNESETILGPTGCPLSRIQNRWRHHLLVKGPEPSIVSRIHRVIDPAGCSRGKDRVIVDVDPLSML